MENNPDDKYIKVIVVGSRCKHSPPTSSRPSARTLVHEECKKSPKMEPGCTNNQVGYRGNVCQRRASQLISNDDVQTSENRRRFSSPYTRLALVCLVALLLFMESISIINCNDIRHGSLDYFRHEHVSGGGNGDNNNMAPGWLSKESRAFNSQQVAQQEWRFPRNIKEIITSSLDTTTEAAVAQQKKSPTDNSIKDNAARSNNNDPKAARVVLPAGYLLKKATEALNEANKLANTTVTKISPPTSVLPGVVTNQLIENLKRKETGAEMKQASQAVNQTGPTSGDNQRNNRLTTEIGGLSTPSNVAGNILRNQGAHQSTTINDQAMTPKHKFTFKANGKELALEPPTSLLSLKNADQLSTNGLLSGTTTTTTTTSKGKNFRKKDNRIGEFINSDDESGFDAGSVEGDSGGNSRSLSAASEMAPTVDSNGPIRKQHQTSGGSQSNLELPAPSSSSSSLMSGKSDNGGDDDNDDNDELSSSLKTKSALSVAATGGKLQTSDRKSSGGRIGGGNDNNIISEWSKSESRQQQSRPRSAQGSAVNNSGGSKFSALISGGTSHPGEPQAHSKHQAFSKPLKSKSATRVANTTGNTAADSSVHAVIVAGDKDSSYSKANIKRSAYPKAPVFAKSRYASMTTTTTTTTEPNYADQGESIRGRADESFMPGRGESSGALNSNNDYNRQSSSSYSSNSFLASTVPSRSPPADVMNPIRASTSSSVINNDSHSFGASNQNHQPYSIFEYKTNYTNSMRTHNAHDRQQKMIGGADDAKRLPETKAPIVQRDISLQPYSMAPPSQQNEMKSAPSFNQDLMSTLTDALRQNLRTSSMNSDVVSTKASINNGQNFLHKENFAPSFPALHQDLRRTSGAQQSSLTSMGQPIGGFPPEISRMSNERTSSIVRMGPILPHSNIHSQLRSLMPAAAAFLAHAQEEHRASNRLRALAGQHHHHHNHHHLQQQQQQQAGNVDFFYPPPPPLPLSKQNLAAFNMNMTGLPPLAQEQMVANSNHLGVSHLGPQAMSMSGGMSGSGDNLPQDGGHYNGPMVNGGGGVRDYSGDKNSVPGPSSVPDHSTIDGQNGQSGPSTAASGMLMNDNGGDQRMFGSFGDMSSEMGSYEPNSSFRSPTPNAMQGSIGSNIGGPNNNPLRPTNSRSSASDVYYNQEPKSSREAPSNGGYPMVRGSSVDPYGEDVSNGIPTSEYERDLADLDEEFNRATYRRPSTPSQHHLMSDSYMNMSPERYEGRGNRYNRRPSSYGDYSPDYMGTAGSMSNGLPRNYHHRQYWPSASASSSSSYGDSGDLWPDTGADYSPVASYMAPNHYSYRWPPARALTYPRYSRTYSPYLATAASEQHHLNPYSMLPAGYTSALPTETVSFTLSPLAAAAAAAASALAAADKSRHSQAWLTIPRIATTSSLAAPISAATAAATAPAATSAHPTTALPAPQAPTHTLPTAYHLHPRPYNPYALGSMPFYAIAAPRPTLATAATQASAPSIISPYHYGATPIFAYRPSLPVMPSSLLTAASFAYPMRLPTIASAPSTRYSIGTAPARTIGGGNVGGLMRHPFYSDLQFAETKPKSNLTSTENNNNSNRNSPIKVSAASFTAMARNLTRKMFGSASQIRPLHVAPPPNNPLYDFFTASHNSTSFL